MSQLSPTPATSGLPTLEKQRFSFILDCSRRSVALVPVATGKHLRVAAQPLGGVTLAGSFTLRGVADEGGGGELPRDFSPARTIAGAGGTALVTTDELAGFTHVEVSYSHSSYTSNQHAEVSATLARDVVPLAGTPVAVGGDEAVDDVPL